MFWLGSIFGIIVCVLLMYGAWRLVRSLEDWAMEHHRHSVHLVNPCPVASSHEFDG